MKPTDSNYHWLQFQHIFDQLYDNIGYIFIYPHFTRSREAVDIGRIESDVHAIKNSPAHNLIINTSTATIDW